MRIIDGYIVKRSKLSTIEEYLTIFFYGACFFVTFLLTLAFFLTMVDQFIPSLMIISSIISFIAALFFGKHIKQDVKKLPHLTIPIIIMVIFISAILIFFPHDSFGGADESIYSNLSVYLSRNGTLHDNMSGNARLPIYTVWLAIQNMFFGIEWLLRSNVILVILGLFSLYLTSSLLGTKMNGLITVVLFSSCMPFLWFSRQMLSENISFFLLWSLILFLLIFLKTKKYVYLAYIFISGWLFSLTRIEGFFIQISTFLTLILILMISRAVNFKKNVCILLIYITLIVSSSLVIKTSYFDSYFGTNINDVKVSLTTEISTQLSQKSKSDNEIKEVKYYDKIPSFVFEMTSKYNFPLVFFAIFCLAIMSFNELKRNKLSKISPIIIVFAIISPEFLKFINPGVTLDQPWMYRRYFYALLPLGYLSLSMILNKFKIKKLLSFIFIFFLLINLLLSKDIIFLKNNWLLINEMEKVTKDISRNDLVIIRVWTLNFYPPTNFIRMQKGVRTIISSQDPDLSPWLKIYKGVPYKKLYLLSDQEEKSYPNFEVRKINSINIHYKQLEPACRLYQLGEYLKIEDVYNYALLPYSEVINFCGKPGNKINEYNGQLFLYEMIYEKAEES